MKKYNETDIRIDKEFSISENWYKGRIEHKEDVYEFWFIHSVGKYLGDDFPYRIEWFRKNVPSEIRTMENKIIEEFEKQNKLKWYTE